jgi:hypothetical protein
MRTVVTGATGFVGRPLVAALTARGDAVTVLTRDPARAAALPELAGAACVAADLESAGPWQETLAGAGAVLHLAGEPIASRRWDARAKQTIRDSRVESTRVLVEALAALPPADRPGALVTASGVDYYPFAEGPAEFDDDEVTERDPPGDGFLARVCRDWEAEAALAEPLGVRVVRLRTGLVLGRGGALGRMAGPFRFFVGGRVGSGRQWVSWIHLDDVVAAYLAASVDARWTGPVNLVAPEAARNAALASALGAALGRPSWLPVPAAAVRAAVGELAEYLLHGRKVVPARLRALGFAFRHPALREAVAAAVR